MEIERKYLIHQLPENLESYPQKTIEQGYLCTNPVVRIRKQNEDFFLTYKSAGLMSREEYNLPLTKEAYEQLKNKTDGYLISKTRYLIPLGEKYTIELDVFKPPFAPLYMAEVEFSSLEEAENFIPPEWFGEDVTFDGSYHNSAMSRGAHLNTR